MQHIPIVSNIIGVDDGSSSKMYDTSMKFNDKILNKIAQKWLQITKRI